MNNAKFATKLHILTLLGRHPDQWLSSDWIARSIRINPVVVRKELGALKELGWVVSKKGKTGGSMLNVATSQLTLADIYESIKPPSILGHKNDCQNTKCPVGMGINSKLESLFDETDGIVVSTLQQKTLKDFIAQFK